MHALLGVASLPAAPGALGACAVRFCRAAIPKDNTALLMSVPHPANRYHVDHTQRLRRTLHALIGRHLINRALSPGIAANALFHAPFAGLSHHTDLAPPLTSGNQVLFEKLRRKSATTGSE